MKRYAYMHHGQEQTTGPNHALHILYPLHCVYDDCFAASISRAIHWSGLSREQEFGRAELYAGHPNIALLEIFMPMIQKSDAPVIQNRPLVV